VDQLRHRSCVDLFIAGLLTNTITEKPSSGPLASDTSSLVETGARHIASGFAPLGRWRGRGSDVRHLGRQKTGRKWCAGW
jgi:hypothetical protein